MGKFTYGESEIAFTDPTAAEGSPLVLIHGAGGDRLSWPPEMRRARDYPVVALELPAHGDSSGRSARALGEYVGAVIALLDELGAARAVLAGHSMGGAIAQLTALRHPDRVAGLVLIGTGAHLPVNPRLLEGVRSDFHATVGQIVKWSFALHAPANLKDLALKRFAEVPPEVLHDDFAACDAFDVRQEITKWRGPTLVVCGEVDKMTPPDYSRYLAEQIPDARLAIVAGAGHMVMLEKPQAVAALIREFMAALLSQA